MEFLKDIFINLLSDSIWALGVFMFARLFLLKNHLVVIFFQKKPADT
jgi:hypothetical protein